MKISTLLIGLLAFLLTASSHAQKTLNLYKSGRFKVIQFKVGDVLQFRMKNDDVFYKLPIKDLKGDKIIFPTGAVHIHSIAAVRCNRNKNLARFLNSTGQSLYVFAGSWIFFTGVDVLYGGNPLTWTVAIVSGTSVALGWILVKLSKPKTYKLNEKRFLKILEPDEPAAEVIGSFP